MRAALLYLLLVGVPALGVVVILRVGAGITPPAAIGGEWTVDSGAAPGAPAVVRCGDVLERRVVHAALVSQSGVMAAAALRDARGATWAEGTITLHRDSAVAAGDLMLVGCPAGRVRATLTFDDGLRPQAMTLTTAPSDCGDCSPSGARLVRGARDAGAARPAGPAARSGH